MSASVVHTQSKVTDFYRPKRDYRSPSPKRPKTQNNTPRTPTVNRTPAGDSISNLELPVTYAVLIQHFNSADQLVCILYNRREMITFTKLQCGVQKATRKNFGLKNLGQIKTVYPEAYLYEQVRITRQEGIMQNRRPCYELTIKPNLVSDLSAYGLRTPMKSPQKFCNVTPTKTPPRPPAKRPYYAVSPMKTPPRVSRLLFASDCPSSPSRTVAVLESTKAFTGGRLVARSQVFRRNLFNILRKHHKEFLLTLSPPIRLSDEEDAKLTSWHPKFILDEETLHIAASELPEAPVVEKVACAKDLLSISGAVRLAKVEVAAAAVADDKTPESKGEHQPASNAASPLIKGIPTKLLEKIREKESQKKRTAMLRSPAEEAMQLRLSRLPDFVRIINMYFATEGKSVLSSARVNKKLTESYSSPMSLRDIEDHVKLLRELVPDWISHTEITDKGSYLRLNRNMDVGEVVMALEKHTTVRAV